MLSIHRIITSSNPKATLEELKEDGFKVVTIIDPGKKDMAIKYMMKVWKRPILPLTRMELPT